MKFTSIHLTNYIGIYNGMGLYDINIDMTKCQNRITIIRGDNGSGKSTLAKAMSVFPDPNDSFIPGMPARKEIILADGPTLYRLLFIHGVKANGDREVTKAYITKTFGNTAVELNENGNVSSYKDILYSELGLDANFVALSQLSNDDRGLADKKPAERKRFVNYIISSLETYNSIYKTLSKRSTNLKSMINSIVAKLGVLGDESAVESSLQSIEDRINVLQDLKDKAVTDMAKDQSLISILDPDGSIQLTNTKVSTDLALAQRSADKLRDKITAIKRENGIPDGEIYSLRRNISDKKGSLMVANQLARNKLESLLNRQEDEAKNLGEKSRRLESIKSEYDYGILVDKITIYTQDIADIEATLGSIGISDVMSISKAEYILALETLRDLSEYIMRFKSSTDFEIIEAIINEYMETGRVPSRQNPNEDIDIVEDSKIKIAGVEKEVDLLESRLGLLDKLKIRPSGCMDDKCPFISEALEFSKSNPHSEIDRLDALATGYQALIDHHNKEVSRKNDYNNAVNTFAIIVREVDKNGAILSKMPNGEMFADKKLFFSRLLSGYSFEYMAEIYKYIEYANLFDTYRQTKPILAEYQAELKVYESKSEVIESLVTDIEGINAILAQIMASIDPINKEISDRELEILQLQERENVYDTIISYEEELKPILQNIAELESMLTSNQKKMQKINEALSRIAAQREAVGKYSFDLSPLMRERDKLVHTLQMMKDYVKERDELQANYEFIETIKYYSSPTTGIQLVFMELYMGKIIALANELLSLLFRGTFVIQPFIINESEFRIPCLGDGYINDDISSMSSSQIGMISMILSFSLLYHSSTKYNIIKLDEIDGPLDQNNRLFFSDVLNNIMDIMGTEQCIMISHNAELQVDNADVILLKHDLNNTEYRRGNIIWSFQ